MMTKDVILARVAAIVSTLSETNGSPESMLYIFCEMNMEDYEMIRNILTRAGLIIIKGNYVTLTEQGVRTAQEIDKRLGAK